MSELPSISVIIPIYNAAGWVGPTVGHVVTALRQGGWERAEIVIVNDGSTDDTAGAIERLDTGDIELITVTTENQGRFLARQEGLNAASNEFAFLVDARVFVDEGALSFLAQQVKEHPERRVWNGHTRTATSWKPWTRFWNPLTFVAWYRYLGSPRTTSFGIEDYDHYPKGTGFFFAPREQLLELCAAFDTTYDDVSKASDDTLLIRPLAESDRIFISPEFGGLYFPREGFVEFVKHTYFRGTTFVDGHLRPGSRFNTIFWAGLPVAGVAVVLAALVAKRSPRLFARLVGAGVIGGPLAARVAGLPLADGASFVVLTPLFSTTYAAGIVRGLIMRSRASKSSSTDA